MHHPDHLDAVRDQTVQDEIAAHGKIPAVRGDVRACRPQPRVGGQQGAFVLDLIQQAVSRAGTVLGDIEPKIDQVFIRLRRPSDIRYLPLRVVGGRLFGSACLLKAPSGFGLDRLHIRQMAGATVDPLLP